MQWVMGLAAVLVCGTVVAGGGKGGEFRFGKAELGKVPAGWEVTQTNKGKGSVWKVVADKTAPSKTGHVLAQTAAGEKPVFNLCVPREGSYQDVEVSVAFKAVRGKIDQGG